MFEFHGYEFEKIRFVDGGHIEYRITGPDLDEVRTTPLAWQLFKGEAEAIAAELAGVESANLDTNHKPKQQRTVKHLSSRGPGSHGWFVEKW